MRPPHLTVCALRVQVDVFENSRFFWFVPELPTCAPPPLKAPATLIAGTVLSPMLCEFERMNWNRDSLMKRGLTTAVSVNCTVFSVLRWSYAFEGRLKLPMPCLSKLMRLYW